MLHKLSDVYPPLFVVYTSVASPAAETHKLNTFTRYYEVSLATQLLNNTSSSLSDGIHACKSVRPYVPTYTYRQVNTCKYVYANSR